MRLSVLLVVVRDSSLPLFSAHSPRTVHGPAGLRFSPATLACAIAAVGAAVSRPVAPAADEATVSRVVAGPTGASASPARAASTQGDVDGNGGVDIFDVIKALRCALGLLTDATACGRGDMDCDGSVDIFDVIKVLRAALSLPVTPCSGNAGGTWAAVYGGAQAEEMEGLMLTPDGGSIVCGSSESYGSANGDAWILRLNASGGIVWQRSIGGAQDEYLLDMKPTSDGGFIAAGWTESFGAGQADMWLVKLDGNGNVQWQKTYGGTGTEQAWSVDLTGDGGYVIAGGTTSFGAGGADVWVLRLDASGNIIWQKAYGGPKDEAGGGTYGEYVARIAAMPDSNYVVSTDTVSFGAGQGDVWVLKLDPDGNILWQLAFGGSQDETAWQMDKTSAGGILIAGESESFSPDFSGDLWVLLLDGNGAPVWQKVFALQGMWNEALCVVATSDGGALLGGYFEEAQDWDMYLLRLDAGGNAVWQRRYEYRWDWPNALAQLGSGGYMVAGVGWPNSQGMPEDLLMLKVAEDGGIGTSCSLVQSLSLTASNATSTVTNTTATAQDTTASPMTSTAVVADTTSAVTYQCRQ